MKWNETSIYFDSYIYMNFRNEFAKHAEAGAEVYDCLHVYVHQTGKWQRNCNLQKWYILKFLFTL